MCLSVGCICSHCGVLILFLCKQDVCVLHSVCLYVPACVGLSCLSLSLSVCYFSNPSWDVRCLRSAPVSANWRPSKPCLARALVAGSFLFLSCHICRLVAPTLGPCRVACVDPPFVSCAAVSVGRGGGGIIRPPNISRDSV